VIAPPEVLDSLLAFAPTLHGDHRLIVAVPGVRIPVGRATVMPLDLPHNPTPTRRAQNVGYLLVIDSLRVLHVGDADPDAARFRAALGPTGRADVAVVPFWYLSSRQPALLQVIGAARYLAAHVPLADTVSVKRQLASMSSITVLASRGVAMALTTHALR
jgi:L-ascorbate metabolism protein UlaG (beta-lactamase superfamily)